MIGKQVELGHKSKQSVISRHQQRIQHDWSKPFADIAHKDENDSSDEEDDYNDSTEAVEVQVQKTRLPCLLAWFFYGTSVQYGH